MTNLLRLFQKINIEVQDFKSGNRNMLDLDTIYEKHYGSTKLTLFINFTIIIYNFIIILTMVT